MIATFNGLDALLVALVIVFAFVAWSCFQDFDSWVHYDPDETDPAIGSVQVAASNAPAEIIAAADYKCDGTNDLAQISAACKALPDGGVVQFSQGDFYLEPPASWPFDWSQDEGL